MIPCPPPDFAPRKPKVAFPRGAADCHFHVFGPRSRYPYADQRSYTPPDCLLEHYFQLMSVVGIERAVLVQPSVYGTDNQAHLDALAEAKDRGLEFRMVSVVDETVSDGELQRMNDAGVVGVRFNIMTLGGLSLDLLERMAERIAPLGWHLQLFANAETLGNLENRLAKLPVPLVIDHMGHIAGGQDLGHFGAQALIRLVEGGNTWVKLSAAYRLTNQEHPPYSDVAPLARALIKAGPRRMLWGSDWPHPMVHQRPMPNDGDLADLLADWAPDEKIRTAILVNNPANLYGFSHLS